MILVRGSRKEVERNQMDSILDTIKEYLGISLTMSGYDSLLISKINQTLFELCAIGIGPQEAFTISGSLETWDDFLPGSPNTDGIQRHICLSVARTFNPLSVTIPLSNPDSILGTIKKLLGVTDDGFDQDLITNINSAFMQLYVLGVRPEGMYSIIGSVETWADFFSGITPLASAKTFTYLKTRLIFDPPQHGPTLESFERQISQLEYALRLEAESGLYVQEEVVDEET